MKQGRQEKILEILRHTEYATVEHLAIQLYFSVPTVRRDLAELERKGLIVRSRGGAALKNTPNAAVAFDLRNTLQTKEKSEIARQAAALIEDGDVIFLDASTTVLHMVKHLTEKKDITVLTNSIQLPLLLRNTGIRVYSTGGRLIPNSLAYGGAPAEEAVERFHIDKLFFSSYALTLGGEILDYSEEETALRKKLLQKAKKRYFLCDSSKFGRTSIFYVADLSEVDRLLSDQPFQKEETQ